MADTPMAYCVKCREKREIQDPVQVTMKNGRPAVKGTCPVCGTALFRIGAGSGGGSEAGGDGASSGGGNGGESGGKEKSGGSRKRSGSKSKEDKS